ncbi:hypothetical protein DPMN_029018 [Dreissena polymorpha]|uniref:Uncharacterized protein n=1 Tax=Dreissena polymorpha TaxID=45954 RepID=A0A9D4LVQ2_DREPO|nr:hypothetical protein DPMN_029018 [Dreissena polymorpha]
MFCSCRLIHLFHLRFVEILSTVLFFLGGVLLCLTRQVCALSLFRIRLTTLPRPMDLETPGNLTDVPANTLSRLCIGLTCQCPLY